jgi:hypothetical protein
VQAVLRPPSGCSGFNDRSARGFRAAPFRTCSTKA